MILYKRWSFFSFCWNKYFEHNTLMHFNVFQWSMQTLCLSVDFAICLCTWGISVSQMYSPCRAFIHPIHKWILINLSSKYFSVSQIGNFSKAYKESIHAVSACSRSANIRWPVERKAWWAWKRLSSISLQFSYLENHGIFFPVNISDLSRILLELVNFTGEQNNEMTN